MTVNEAYLSACLKRILEICPSDGISRYFTGMCNYIPAMPQNDIHAHDYYLYVKVFNSFFKDDPNIETLFSDAVEILLSKEHIVETYIAYEVLVNQVILTDNADNFFVVKNKKMINWFEKILKIFRNPNADLDKCKYGIAELWQDGLRGVINSYAELIRRHYNIDMSV